MFDTLPASTFDKVLSQYWQDYTSSMPIGGGMAYEKEVRACTLDGGLDSLKQLDRLLLAVKKQLGNTPETALLKQSPFRVFLLFVAGYAAKVLARALGAKLTWLGYDELSQTYALAPAVGFYSLAGAVPVRADKPLAPVFLLFVLGARLFGRFERQFFDPVSGALVNESLYRTVSDYVAVHTAVIPMPSPTPASPQSTPSASAHTLSFPLVGAMVNPAKPAAPQTTIQPIGQPSAKTNTTASQEEPAKLAVQASAAKPSATTPDNQTHINQPKASLNLPKQPTKASPPKKDEFAELKADLQALPAISCPHDEHCKKAIAVLQKANTLLGNGDINLDELPMPQRQTITQALTVLGKIAEAGNTDAMLSLALYGFEGILMPAAPEQAGAWVKKAANANDIRAQKLLSRLHYQGLGVERSVDMGQFWLEKAATGGHPEAKKIQAQFSQIRMRQDEFRAEAVKDKRFVMMLGVSALVLIFVLWLAMKFLG